jgi:hypothetical protein
MLLIASLTSRDESLCATQLMINMLLSPDKFVWTSQKWQLWFLLWLLLFSIQILSISPDFIMCNDFDKKCGLSWTCRRSQHVASIFFLLFIKRLRTNFGRIPLHVQVIWLNALTHFIKDFYTNFEAALKNTALLEAWVIVSISSALLLKLTLLISDIFFLGGTWDYRKTQWFHTCKMKIWIGTDDASCNKCQFSVQAETSVLLGWTCTECKKGIVLLCNDLCCCGRQVLLNMCW